MSRTLIGPGVYEYPYTEEGLAEAKRDAHWRANDNDKAFRKDRGTRCVLTDNRGYYGPIGKYWEKNIVWRGCVLVYTAEPDEEVKG